MCDVFVRATRDGFEPRLPGEGNCPPPPWIYQTPGPGPEFLAHTPCSRLLIPFDDIDRHRGVFLGGDRPLWLFSNKGSLVAHGMARDPLLYCGGRVAWPPGHTVLARVARVEVFIVCEQASQCHEFLQFQGMPF